MASSYLHRPSSRRARVPGVDLLSACGGSDSRSTVLDPDALKPTKHAEQIDAFLERGVGSMAMQPLNPEAALTDDMFLSGVDGDNEALELIKADGAYKLSIAFAWTLMGYGLGQFGADWVDGKDVPQLVVARGVQLDSAAAVEQFTTASADPSSVFAERSRYEEYLPLYGNVSYESRRDYWTSAVDPPSGSTESGLSS